LEKRRGDTISGISLDRREIPAIPYSNFANKRKVNQSRYSRTRDVGFLPAQIKTKGSLENLIMQEQQDTQGRKGTLPVLILERNGTTFELGRGCKIMAIGCPNNLLNQKPGLKRTFTQ